MNRAMCIMIGWAEHQRVKVGVANKNWPIQRIKREIVRVGQGFRECEAGYETNNCEEFRVRWRGPLHLNGGQNMGVSRWVP